MISYRRYFLGHDGKIKAVEVVECSTDALAMEHAEQRVADSNFPNMEVWERGRRVGLAGPVIM